MKGNLVQHLKKLTKGGWKFLFQLANYQTITGTFANSYTFEDIVVKNSWNNNFSSMILIVTLCLSADQSPLEKLVFAC